MPFGAWLERFIKGHAGLFCRCAGHAMRRWSVDNDDDNDDDDDDNDDNDADDDDDDDDDNVWR